MSWNIHMLKRNKPDFPDKLLPLDLGFHGMYCLAVFGRFVKGHFAHSIIHSDFLP